MDLSNCKISKTYYGGSEKKLGLITNGNEYMIKFQKQSEFGKRNNHISEYIGSHIFEMLGFECQETYLATYKGEQVVACRNFITDGCQFVPFNDVGESTLDRDKEAYQYSYEDIMSMLRDNSKLTNVEATISRFWDLFIVDALIGNFDRHGANWGFLKKYNKYKLAPIFDNGSSLFPNLIDETEMEEIIHSEIETNKRIYSFPTSQIKLNGNKSSYYEVINSLQYNECNISLANIYTKINLNQIYFFIDNDVLFINEVQKRFYKHMITERYNKIIKASYLKLIGEKK